MSAYAKFLERKSTLHKPAGLDIAHDKLNANMYPFQKDLTVQALRRGRAALFSDCGTGKTLMELEWAHQVNIHTERDVLILAPLAVSKQTRGEGEKFGIPVNICENQSQVIPGINITNYEKMHHFDFSKFGGLVLDESSILKSHDGSTRNELIERSQVIPYRLACTATPSPNDYMELGNHSEFLGVMSRTGMLATYFNHDGGETSKWRLKGHAVKPYWKWIASWASMVSKPSDLGYSDDGFVLPPIDRIFHKVETEAQDGLLFAVEAQSLSERRESRKISVGERVERLAKMVNASSEQWLIWADLNAEADAAERAINGAVQVAGADTPENKESRMLGFSAGKHRVLVTKPSIAGFGMNWQNCHNMAFMGLSDSWEQTYQAERRCWRYGQKSPVDVHFFVTDRDDAVIRNIERKRQQSIEMTQQMIEAMKEAA